MQRSPIAISHSYSHMTDALVGVDWSALGLSPLLASMPLTSVVCSELDDAPLVIDVDDDDEDDDDNGDEDSSAALDEQVSGQQQEQSQLSADDALAQLDAPHVAAVNALQRLFGQERRDSRRAPAADYLRSTQRHGMTSAWRSNMCRWLFATGDAFDMAPDTVAVAVHFMDTYLSHHSVDKTELQLLSLVALFVASKFHETDPITLTELLTLAQRKFGAETMVAMEAKLLQVLDWRLNPRTSFSFARELVHLLYPVAFDPEDAEAALDDVLALLQRVTEDIGSLRFQPSVVAIVGVLVASPEHQSLHLDDLDVCFSPSDLEPCFQLILPKQMQAHPDQHEDMLVLMREAVQALERLDGSGISRKRARSRSDSLAAACKRLRGSPF